MKWLKIVDTIPPPDPLSDGSYIYITDKQPLKIVEESPLNSVISFNLPPDSTGGKSSAQGKKEIVVKEWVRYSFGKKGLWISEGKKEHYQIFCGGFLLFYDDVVRNAVVDHILYLKWDLREKKSGPDKENRRLYDAVTIYIDPPPAHKNNKYKGIDLRHNIPSVQPLPAYGNTVDPPPPPPPPPPRINS